LERNYSGRRIFSGWERRKGLKIHPDVPQLIIGETPEPLPHHVFLARPKPSGGDPGAKGLDEPVLSPSRKFPSGGLIRCRRRRRISRLHAVQVLAMAAQAIALLSGPPAPDQCVRLTCGRLRPDRGRPPNEGMMKDYPHSMAKKRLGSSADSPSGYGLMKADRSRTAAPEGSEDTSRRPSAHRH